MKLLYWSFICVLIASVSIGCTLTKYNYSQNYTESEVFVSESREVEAFNNIEMNVVGEVVFAQSDVYSLVIEGDKDLVKRHKSYVENGNLIISVKGEKVKGDYRNGVRIHITAPDLQQLEFDGVGSFTCKEPLNLQQVDLDYSGVGTLYIKDLKCDRLCADINGVGEADINVVCKDLVAEINGIGSLILKGTARQAKINRNGIGIVNTENLSIGNR